MQIDWWTVALQAINVLILVWLLGHFLFRPVMGAIAARQAAADTLLADAQRAKDEAVAQTAALNAQNDAFAAEAEQRRAELKISIEAERIRLLDQVKSETDALYARTAAATAAERARTKADLEEKAATLAGRIAGQLLGRLPAAGVTDMLFDALLEHVGALSDDDRRKLANEAPLAIVTATPVLPEARAHYAAALGTVLRVSIDPQFEVDPALVSGFELRGPHIQVRNSWRSDLDAVLAKLKVENHARIG